MNLGIDFEPDLEESSCRLPQKIQENSTSVCAPPKKIKLQLQFAKKKKKNTKLNFKFGLPEKNKKTKLKFNFGMRMMKFGMLFLTFFF